MTSDAIRNHVIRLLNWEDAHVGFDAAVEGIPPKLQGVQPNDLPYSPWQLIEHLRIAQHDILDFCENPDYREMAWPKDYWPSSSAPGPGESWDESIRLFRADREALKQLAVSPGLGLTAQIPHGSGQTYLRELLLVADHNAYHVGQLVAVRRMLGIWPPE